MLSSAALFCKHTTYRYRCKLSRFTNCFVRCLQQDSPKQTQGQTTVQDSAMYFMSSKELNEANINTFFKRFPLQELINNIQQRAMNIDVTALSKKWAQLQEISREKGKYDNEIAVLRKQRSDPALGKEEKDSLSEKLKLLVKEQNNCQKSWRASIDQLLPQVLMIPNVVHKDTPPDKDSVIYESGKIPTFSFKPAGHFELCTKSGEFINSRNAGPEGYYLQGNMALLELALQWMFQDEFSDAGYIVMTGSDFCKPVMLEGCGINFDDPTNVILMNPEQWEDGKNVTTPRLVGSASIPSLIALHVKSVADGKCLPARYICSGSHYAPHGTFNQADTFSLFNAIQTSQVHFLIACKDKQEVDIEQNNCFELLKHIFQRLELYYNVTLISAKNLSFVESLRTEIQMFSPSLRKHVPVASVSRYEDFISRRLYLHHHSNGQIKNMHLIHGCAVNVTSVIGCIVENLQTESGSYRIPNILLPYVQ